MSEVSAMTRNGRSGRKVSIPDTESDPLAAPTTIPLSVGGRNGLQPQTEGRYNWKVEAGAKKNYGRLGERLACSEDLYRNGSDGLGLIQVLPNGKTRPITRGSDLAPVIATCDALTVGGESMTCSRWLASA